MGQPQTKLIVTVSGDPEALDSTLTLVIKQNGEYKSLDCSLSAGKCEIHVSGGEFYVVATAFPAPLVAVAIQGSTEKTWTGGWDRDITYRYSDGKIVARVSLQPAAEGGTLRLHVEASKACIVRLENQASNPPASG